MRSDFIGPPEPPMSAGRAKRLIGGKKERRGTQWPSTPVPQGPRDDHFACVDCQKTHPITELGRKCGGQGGSIRCKACIDKRLTRRKVSESQYKHRTKAYKSGKNLPKWMYT